MCSGGVLLPPLYMRGAELQGRFPSRLRVGFLVGLQLSLLITRKFKSYLYAAGSFLESCAASSPDGSLLESVGPTIPCPGECIGPPCGYPGVTSPTGSKTKTVPNFKTNNFHV